MRRESPNVCRHNVSLSGSNYGIDKPTPPVTLQPGHNSLTLTVRRRAVIILRLTEDRRTVLFPSIKWFFATKVRCLRGEGTGRPVTASLKAGDIVTTRGGLYEITVADLPGYLSIPPFQVEVPDRGEVEYTIEVTQDGS